eukprot:EG_transcript_19716
MEEEPVPIRFSRPRGVGHGHSDHEVYTGVDDVDREPRLPRCKALLGHRQDPRICTNFAAAPVLIAVVQPRNFWDGLELRDVWWEVGAVEVTPKTVGGPGGRGGQLGYGQREGRPAGRQGQGGRPGRERGYFLPETLEMQRTG